MIEKNVWQSAVSEELTEAMRLCGCDEKYTSGNASDFERLRELLRIAHLLRGHSALIKLTEMLEKRYSMHLSENELIEENACALWQGRVSALTSREREKSDEKYNNLSNAIKLSELSKNGLDYRNFIADVKSRVCNENAVVLVRLSSQRFSEPNPYLAGRIYDNCQKIQDDILCCQIICEILSDKSCQKAQIYLSGENKLSSYSRFISFLKKHNMKGRLHIEISADDDARDVLDVCRLSEEKCFVTPFVDVTKNANKETVEKIKESLSAIYPIGMLELIK